MGESSWMSSDLYRLQVLKGEHLSALCFQVKEPQFLRMQYHPADLTERKHAFNEYMNNISNRQLNICKYNCQLRQFIETKQTKVSVVQLSVRHFINVFIKSNLSISPS